MKSVKRRFIKIAKKKPYWSSYICFAEAIKEQNFSKKSIYRWFNKIVDKNDYLRKEKRSILRHLCNLSNIAVDDIK